MENYIVINGQKAELTDEQLKQLGLKVDEKRNNPFERRYGNEYFIISENDSISSAVDRNFNDDNIAYKNVNYFNDYEFTKQVIWHQLLNRMLLKYAYDNNAEDREWNCETSHYHIAFSYRTDELFVGYDDVCKYPNVVYFSNSEVAERAIEDIVKPFMKEHPEFVW